MVKLVNKNNSSFDIYCGRGTPFGNPLHIGELSRDEVCDMYESYFYDQLETNSEFKKAVDGLFDIACYRDLFLGCHCKPQRCHVETLQNYLNIKVMEYKLGEF